MPAFGRIRFAPSLEGATITVDSTIVVPARSVTIEGPGLRGITLSGGGRVRVLHFEDAGFLTEVSVTNGNHAQLGGGIYAGRFFGMQHGTIAYNSAPTGGGIYAPSVELGNVTVAHNTSSIAGSAISFLAAGGGIKLYNVTVARNGPAAGIVSRGNPTASSLTILNNSIIANNGTPLRNCVNLYYVNYEGNSISDDTSCGSMGQVYVADPLLGPLAGRGGPGHTFDFARESPALDGTESCSFGYDQRHVYRDAVCDVGAFEFTDFTNVTLTIDANATVDAATGTAVVTGTMKCTHDGGRLGVIVRLQQQKGGKTPTLVKGSGGMGMTCAKSTQTWRATVTPESGTFDTGAASATAATNDPPAWIKPGTTSGSVKLARTRR